MKDVTLYSCEEWIDFSSLLALLPSEIWCILGPRCFPLWLHVMQHPCRSEYAVTAAGEPPLATLLADEGHIGMIKGCKLCVLFPAGFPTMPLALREVVAAPKGKFPRPGRLERSRLPGFRHHFVLVF
jgi:hypothetical protein